MDRSRWRKINGVDRAQLSEARLQAHYAAQWLARLERARGMGPRLRGDDGESLEP